MKLPGRFSHFANFFFISFLFLLTIGCKIDNRLKGYYWVGSKPVPMPTNLLLVTPATSPTNNNQPTLQVDGAIVDYTVRLFSDTNCTIEVGSVVAASTSTNITASTNLAAGIYTFKAKNENTTGSLSDCSTNSVTLMIDTQNPTLTFSGQPSAHTNSANANFTFTATDVLSGVDTIMCKIDSGAFAACTSPHNLVGLSVGAHTLFIEVTDFVGNSLLTSVNWNIDTTIPTLQIAGITSAQSVSSSARFKLVGSDLGGAGISSYQCKIDGGSYATYASTATIGGLNSGAHTLSFKTLDAATNSSAVFNYPLFIGDWQTKLAETGTSNLSSYNNFAVIDAGGTIYNSVTLSDPKMSIPKVLRKSIDGGSTWSAFVLPAGGDSSLLPSAIPGQMYYANQSSDNLTCQLYITNDSADTWALIDTYSVAGSTCYAKNYYEDTATGIKFLLILTDEISTSNYVWLIRRSADGGTTWANVDSYAGSDTWGFYESRKMYSDGTNFFVLGTYYSGGNAHWLIRRSTDNGITWATVDDYQRVAGLNSVPSSMAKDSSGNYYVAGYGSFGAGVTRWIVRKSTNGGASFSTINDYLGATWSQASKIIINSFNDILVSGITYNGNYSARVRRSTDGGTSWSTVIISNVSQFGGSFLTDTTENLYYGAANSASPTSVIIFKSTDRGVSFSNIDTYNHNGKNTTLSRFFIDGSNIYAFLNASYISYFESGEEALIRKYDGSSWSAIPYVGGTRTGDTRLLSVIKTNAGSLLTVGQQGFHWLIKRSTNDGTSWANTDVLDDTSKHSMAFKIAQNPINNDLYAIGYHQRDYLTDSDVYSLAWLVRKSTDDGLTWVTVDSQSIDSNGNILNGIAFNSAGEIFLSGYTSDPTWGSKWVVRKSSNNGTTWATVDNFYYVSWDPSSAQNIFINPNDDAIFVVGTGVDTNGDRNWTVRKSSDGGTTWATVDQFIGVEAMASAGVVGTDGKIYVAGHSNYEMIVRASSDGGTTWATVDTITTDAFSDIYHIPVWMGVNANGDIFINSNVTSDYAAAYYGTFNIYSLYDDTHLVRRGLASGSYWEDVYVNNGILGSGYIDSTTGWPVLPSFTSDPSTEIESSKIMRLEAQAPTQSTVNLLDGRIASLVETSGTGGAVVNSDDTGTSCSFAWDSKGILCESAPTLSSPDISTKLFFDATAYWSNPTPSSSTGIMVFDIGSTEIFSAFSLFKTYNNGLTHVKIYRHPTTSSTPPGSTDGGWIDFSSGFQVMIPTNFSTNSNIASTPLKINVTPTSSRYIKIELQNDGSDGLPGWIQIRSLKGF